LGGIDDYGTSVELGLAAAEMNGDYQRKQNVMATGSILPPSQFAFRSRQISSYRMQITANVCELGFALPKI
jgi:hypothetical protein